ncbi:MULTISPECIES: hypothetical protein [Pseudonocardia]|uniref:Uncharacterized protein n=2 Tax=Pseudonocardia TaxID=1847 RepID=A0A1Y2MJB6_PSEAH|nr:MULTISPECIES: hypothetical protein [Pseudonocardia]OSY35340.1 hypothetical protein BG845_06098 [Pseudonocardia autotrophica]TDN75494.1 hypothetical protein C8E95_4666 [Pseudonocardia autotrophica]BBF99460.1 hypothetical protein Pdca_06700 [Pseudonocardia autotrophica]GEC29318.1 hypothetical protein PSA01_63470 [Pseudonocardia saturnea]
MSAPAVNAVYADSRSLFLDVVVAGLDRTTAALSGLHAHHPATAAERAAHAHRLAELHRRRARWWAVLERSAADRLETHRVHRLAVIAARAAADDGVRFWLDAARSWEAIADRERTGRGAVA